MQRLSNADRLITGLSSENDRWQKDLKELKKKKKWLLGDCILSSAFLSYTGAFSWEFRNQMIYEDWMGDVDRMSLPRILTDDVEIARFVLRFPVPIPDN